MTNTFDHIKYAALPWAYEKQFPNMTPYLNLVEDKFDDKIITSSLEPGDFYEFVLIVPGYMRFYGSQLSNAVTLLGGKNPSVNSTYHDRFGFTNLVSSSLSDANQSKILIAVSMEISTTTNTQYKVSTYAKQIGADYDNFEFLELNTPIYSGTLLTGKKLYVSNSGHVTNVTSPQLTGTRNRAGPVVVYSGRIINTGNTSTTLTMIIKGSVLGPEPSMSPIHMGDIGFSFSRYILEQLRNDYNVLLLGDGEIENTKINLEISIANAVKFLAQKWYNLTKNIFNEHDELINFILFYLYYNGRQVPIYKIWIITICT